MVLVGGRGTRLGAITDRAPKPLLRVAGRPFIDWVLDVLRTSGVRRFVLAAGYRADAVRTFASQQEDLDVVVETEPMGTGGGSRLAAASTQGDPVLVANGDSLVAARLDDIWRTLGDASDAVIVGVRVAGEARFGRLRLRGDYLERIDEKVTGDGLVNAGIYAFRRSLLLELASDRPLSLETDVFPTWLAEGRRIRVLALDAPFIDIGIPASLESAPAFVTRFVAPGL